MNVGLKPAFSQISATSRRRIRKTALERATEEQAQQNAGFEKLISRRLLVRSVAVVGVASA